MQLNIPLKFQPFLKSYLWGGQNLKHRLSTATNSAEPIGESWEIADYHQDVSIVNEGPFKGKSLRELMQTYEQDLCGKALNSMNRGIFPLLLKIIDSHLSLSIQVHPDDESASRWKKGELGKSEAWYIVDAAAGASLYCGVRPGVTKEQLAQALTDSTVTQYLQEIPVTAGDIINIPAGTVHALGAGIVVIEIQQNSNITYRLFDWNRVGPDGKARELHVEKGLEVIKLEDQTAGKKALPLRRVSTKDFLQESYIECDKFIFEKLSHFNKNQISLIFDQNSFHLFTAINGSFHFKANGETVILNHLDSVLIPAAVKECFFSIAEAEKEKSSLLHFFGP